MRAVVFMCHRICAPTTNTRCYFARGTAITPTDFAQLAESTAAVATIVTWRTFFERYHPESHDRYAIFSFDDGYREIAALDRLPPSVFYVPVRRPLAVDTYYAMLHNSMILDPPELPDWCTAHHLPPPAKGQSMLDWWISGPVKQRLMNATTPKAIDHMLTIVAELLRPCATAVQASMPSTLSDDACRRLVAQGHEIGGHSHSHYRFRQLTRTEIAAEVQQSADFVRQFHAHGPISYAYADGDPGEATMQEVVEDTLRASHFSTACLATGGRATTTSDNRLRLPRINPANLESLSPQAIAKLYVES